MPSADEAQAGNRKDRQTAADSHRDNRDSVWKRLDSRYVSRDEHRSESRPNSHSRARESITLPREPYNKQGRDKDGYNKRRYDDSFALSKQREIERKARNKSTHTRGGGSDAVPSEDQTRDPRKTTSIDSQRTLSDHNPRLAAYRTSSPEHRRERPFKLALSRRLTAKEKLKGKVADVGDSSDAASSAKKSLFPELPLQTLNTSVPIEATSNPKIKSWYEITLEEEETESQIEKNQSLMINDEQLLLDNEDEAEKILEEEDWNDEEGTYDFENDDLLEDEAMEDALMEEEEPEGVEGSASIKVPMEGEAGSGSQAKGDAPVEYRHEALAFTGSETDPVVSPSVPRWWKASPTKTETKKKKSVSSPLVKSLSLKKRNLLMGKSSPKAQQRKSGPSPGHKEKSGPSSSVSSENGLGQKMSKDSKAKPAKAGNSKPPKISR